jgi:hypothetical protein
MGRYSMVYSDTWTDGAFQEASDAEKLAFIYAITSPMGNQAGFYRLPPSYVGLSLGKEKDEALGILSSLSKRNLIRYDAKTETVLIPNYLKYNTAKSMNQYKGLNSCIRALPLSDLHIEFFHSLCRHCPDAVGYLDQKILTYVKAHFKNDGSAKGALIEAVLNIHT